MELFKETLLNFLKTKNIQISFPDLEINKTEIGKSETSEALNKTEALMDCNSLKNND